MKALIVIGIIGIVIFFFSRKKSIFGRNERSTLPTKFFSLNDGNQSELLLSVEVSQDWLNSIKEKYDWSNFDEYDNRMWQYMEYLFDNMAEEVETDSLEEFWNNLSRPQKVFCSFLAFNGDTENGGVYQFFFNRPIHSLSILQVWEELELHELQRDYTKVLEELLGSLDNLEVNKTTFNNQNLKWEKRFKAFSDGRKDLPSAEIIEDYYYENDFKRKLHKSVADYIEKNIHLFARIKE